MWFDNGDDENKSTKDEPMGGPEAGDYTPPVPVPGEGQGGVPNSAQ